MSRKNESILNVLTKLPWWIVVIIAIVCYVSLKYIIPAIEFQNVFFNGIAKGAPVLAPAFSIVILIAAAWSAFNAWRKGQLFESQKDIETIRQLSWREFEELVGEAYRRKSYSVTETGGGGSDGGVDLILKRGGEKLLVQCKHWKMSKVGVKVIRELYGVVAAEGATGGIVISTGSFTQEAIDFAKGKLLELINGAQLQQLIKDIKETSAPMRDKSKKVLCPNCGAEMVLRTTKKGQNAGEKFWGCSTFPKCQTTKPYNG